MGIELKVANMSSPFIRENRHSDVDISVSNLKWYGPAVDISNYGIIVITFSWIYQESPSQQKRNQHKERRNR